MNKVSVKIINKSDHELPAYETLGSAGMDLRANNSKEIVIGPMERILVPTGLSIELPVGYEAQVRPRSGLSIKKGISLVNAVGTIDSDYRGEIQVPVINLSTEPYTIIKGERIAQMIVAKYSWVEWEETDDLSQTQRGQGGFGSTGV